jgi:hypothetical protein
VELECVTTWTISEGHERREGGVESKGRMMAELEKVRLEEL